MTGDGIQNSMCTSKRKSLELFDLPQACLNSGEERLPNNKRQGADANRALLECRGDLAPTFNICPLTERGGLWYMAEIS